MFESAKPSKMEKREEEEISPDPIRAVADIRNELKGTEEDVAMSEARLERLKEQVAQIQDEHSRDHFQKKIDLENEKLAKFAEYQSLLEKELAEVAHLETDMEDELEQAKRDDKEGAKKLIQ